MISFFEEVAVCTGSFKSKRGFICGIDQNPVGFKVAVARWLPRSAEWMVSVVRWEWSVFDQKFDNFLQLAKIFSSSPHALDIPGKLFGLRDLLHFSQFLNMASKDSNSRMSSPRRLLSRVEAVSLFGIATGKGRPPRMEICL